MTINEKTIPIPYRYFEIFKKLTGSETILFLTICKEIFLNNSEPTEISLKNLVDRTGLSKSGVKRTIIQLCDKGLISKSYELKGGKLSSIYNLPDRGDE